MIPLRTDSFSAIQEGSSPPMIFHSLLTYCILKIIRLPLLSITSTVKRASELLFGFLKLNSFNFPSALISLVNWMFLISFVIIIAEVQIPKSNKHATFIFIIFSLQIVSHDIYLVNLTKKIISC